MQTVLITGCSSGIGEATARAFADAGWRVYATARDTDDIAALAEAGCETATLDVTDPGDVREVVDRIVGEAGRIDCLVNNAGYAQFGPLEDVPVRELHRQFDVNLYGPHRLVREVLPHMREREDGTIVNMSSGAGRIAYPMSGAYCASKFALEAASDALRAEVASFGVDVVVIEPGPVETAFRDRADRELRSGLDRSGAYESLYDAIEDVSSIGGGGPFASSPEEVADVVVNAASCEDPASRYAVGSVGKFATYARFLPDRWRDAAYRLIARFAD